MLIRDFHLLCTFVHCSKTIPSKCSLTSPAAVLAFASPITGKQPKYGCLPVTSYANVVHRHAHTRTTFISSHHSSNDNTGKWVRESRMLTNRFCSMCVLLWTDARAKPKSVNENKKQVKPQKTEETQRARRQIYRHTTGSGWWKRWSHYDISSLVVSCGAQRPESHGAICNHDGSGIPLSYDHTWQ